jgi:putative endonuclease
MSKEPAIYIMASGRNRTDYTGVTSDLPKRIHEHRSGTYPGFSKRYGLNRLVWFEMHDTMETAIAREKQIKNWKRIWKLELIEKDNPHWRDLAEELGFDPHPQTPSPPRD